MQTALSREICTGTSLNIVKEYWAFLMYKMQLAVFLVKTAKYRMVLMQVN